MQENSKKIVTLPPVVRLAIFHFKWFVFPFACLSIGKTNSRTMGELKRITQIFQQTDIVLCGNKEFQFPFEKVHFYLLFLWLFDSSSSLLTLHIAHFHNSLCNTTIWISWWELLKKWPKIKEQGKWNDISKLLFAVMFTPSPLLLHLLGLAKFRMN